MQNHVWDHKYYFYVHILLKTILKCMHKIFSKGHSPKMVQWISQTTEQGTFFNEHTSELLVIWTMWLYYCLFEKNTCNSWKLGPERDSTAGKTLTLRTADLVNPQHPIWSSWVHQQRPLNTVGSGPKVKYILGWNQENMVGRTHAFRTATLHPLLLVVPWY